MWELIRDGSVVGLSGGFLRNLTAGARATTQEKRQAFCESLSSKRDARTNTVKSLDVSLDDAVDLLGMQSNHGKKVVKSAVLSDANSEWTMRTAAKKEVTIEYDFLWCHLIQQSHVGSLPYRLKLHGLSQWILMEVATSHWKN